MATNTDGIEHETSLEPQYAGDPHDDAGDSDQPGGLRGALMAVGLVAACGVCLLPALAAGSVVTGAAVWFGTAGVVVALAAVAAVAWWRRARQRPDRPTDARTDEAADHPPRVG